MALVLSIIALAVGIAAMIIAIKKKPSEKVVVEKTTKVVENAPVEKTTKVVENAPVEHPFVYNATRKCYTLDGTLEVTGGLACLKKKEG